MGEGLVMGDFGPYSCLPGTGSSGGLAQTLNNKLLMCPLELLVWWRICLREFVPGETQLPLTGKGEKKDRSINLWLSASFFGICSLQPRCVEMSN